MNYHARQYAIQILVNAGGPLEHWDFDSDFELTMDLGQALRDAATAVEMGYRSSDVRVVVIEPYTEGQS